MALIKVHIGGAFTQLLEMDALRIPFKDVGSTVASSDLLVTGTESVQTWSLSTAPMPGKLAVVSKQSQTPLPGRYAHVAVSPLGPAPLDPAVLSVVASVTGDHHVVLAGLNTGFQVLWHEPSPVRLDLDRSGGARAALWRASAPDTVLILQQSDLLAGNITGTGVPVASAIKGALGSTQFEVTQVCFHDPRVGVVASRPGAPDHQVVVVRDVATGASTVVDRVSDVTLAVTADALIWSAAFDAARIGLAPQGTARALYYAGPLAKGPVALIAPQPGFDYGYPRVVRNTLMFAQAWPVPKGGPRAARKTAFLAYDLARLSARDGLVVEISDLGLWDDRQPVLEQRPARPGASTLTAVAFFQKPSATAGPDPQVRAALVQL